MFSLGLDPEKSLGVIFNTKPLCSQRLIKVCANLAGVDKHHLSDNEIILPPAILVGNSTLLYAFRPGEQMLHRASPPQTAQYASFPVENLTLELELALELMQAF